MSIYSWGSNIKGQLGDGTTIDKLEPTKIGTKNWKQVSAGVTSTLAIELIKNIIKNYISINQSFVGKSNRDII